VTLSAEHREAIRAAVSDVRGLLEAEFRQIAEGRFGLHPDAPEGRGVEDASGLSLSPSESAVRAQLVAAVRYFMDEGASEQQAIARLLNEATFTAVNRLIAVRVGEGIGALPEVISRGRESRVFREVVRDLFPLIGREPDGGLWIYLMTCGDELAGSAPLLFDRRSPVSVFAPGPATLERAIEIVNEPHVAPVWAEPESLGWTYQFFNSEQERQQMRSESAAPRNSRELAVRNQFFTPSYVVDWLVENTLGRRLREAGYEIELPLLLGEIHDGEPLDLEGVRVLDPACGSGHFLLGAYDVLERAWAARGVSEAAAAPRILPCLFGVEIDARSAQVAQVVLHLRARKAAGPAELPAATIVTAREFPTVAWEEESFLEGLSRTARDLCRELAEALSQAPLLGVLLKVEERLHASIRDRFARPTLADHTSSDSTQQTLEEEILAALEEAAGRADASPAARLFAADARDAVRLVELCLRRYDVVLMNPPFGEPVPATDQYVSVAYPDSPADLYAMFVERGVDLLRTGGYVGSITSRAGFFLIRSEGWRSSLVLPRLRALLDLGSGVMHTAMVEAAAYVLSARRGSEEGAFWRLLDRPDKDAAVRAGPHAEDLHEVDPRRFLDIPGAPAAYWLPTTLIKLFRGHRGFDGSAGVVARLGAHTANDFRYLRCWWEVPDSGGLGEAPRWITFAKGGGYSPHYADLLLVIDWDYQRGTFRGFHGRKGRASPIPENRDYFGRPGLTWSVRSQKGFSVRPVPKGAIFSHRGPMVFSEGDVDGDLFRLAAYLNSALAATLLEAMVAFGSYEVGAVQRLPLIVLPVEAEQMSRAMTETRMREAETDETTHVFVSPWIERPDVSPLRDQSAAIDHVAATSAGVEYAEPISAMFPTRWFANDHRPCEPPSVEDEVSYLLGAALGRWDVRIGAGLTDAPPAPGPFDPLPASSRAMLTGTDGEHPVQTLDGYPLALPDEGLFHDDRGHPEDVVSAVEAAADVVESGPATDGSLRFRAEVRDLRQYLRDRAFSAHLPRYSASQRVAPIYWHLAVPSREWGLWLYLAHLSRETLFAVAGAASRKRRTLDAQAEQLRERVRSSPDRDSQERLERVEALASEIAAFHGAAERVAQSGWRPDLNDGIVLCACPLEELFVDRRWLREIEKHKGSLEAGQYPWAAVQKDYFGVA
jgi:hypothetical protein